MKEEGLLCCADCACLRACLCVEW